jgi:hypothetical protein
MFLQTKKAPDHGGSKILTGLRYTLREEKRGTIIDHS